MNRMKKPFTILKILLILSKETNRVPTVMLSCRVPGNTKGEDPGLLPSPPLSFSNQATALIPAPQA